MKVIIFLVVAIALHGAWVEITEDSAQVLFEPDSNGCSPIDSFVVNTADTSIIGQIRPAQRAFFGDSEPFLLETIGYCWPCDSTRKFFAICPENGRWFLWQEQ